MKHTTRVLIVDDEIQSRFLIRKLLADHFPELIAEEAENVAGALDKIDIFHPDLVFLDVQMRGETGFDLLDKTGPVNFGIIFTTAHSEFAVKAFRYSAMDYLLKPLDAEEFKTATEKAILRIQSHQQPAVEQIEFLKQLKSTHKIPEKLTIPTTEGFLLVAIQDILYCHAVSNYTEFHFGNHQKILSSYTLGYYSELLSDHHFFRIHRSYLVNLSHIKMYKRGDGGVVVMNNDEEIEVSRSHKEAFLKILKP
ncbi:MAG: LytTR family DNA-binding domain-containing protein [Bacteroidota bacterium]